MDATVSLDELLGRYERLMWDRKYDQAEPVARQLCSSFGTTAMAHSALGHLLMYKAFSLGQSQDAGDLFAAARDSYLVAKSLAPNCLHIALRYCGAKAYAGDLEEAYQAYQELKELTVIQNPNDPLWNHPITVVFNGVAKRDARMQRLFEYSLGARRTILHLLIGKLLKDTSGEDLRRRAENLSEEPLLCARLLHAHAIVLHANDFEGPEIRRLLEEASVTEKAVDRWNSSLIASLVHAKVLCLLGSYDTAIEECQRGVKITNASDPMIDDASGKFYHGPGKPERIVNAKYMLKSLKDYMVEVCRQHFKSENRLMQNKLLSTRADHLSDFYAKISPSVVKLINMAVTFSKEGKSATNKSLKYWFCPIKKCNRRTFREPDLLWFHMVNHHKEKASRIPFAAKYEGTSHFFVYLLKDYDKHVFYSPQSEHMFADLIVPDKDLNPLNNMQDLKTREATLALKMLKDRVIALPDQSLVDEYEKEDKEAILQLWHKFLEDSSIDYGELLLPFVRLYQWRQLLQFTCHEKSSSERLITHEDINNVYLNVPDAESQKKLLSGEPGSPQGGEENSGEPGSTQGGEEIKEPNLGLLFESVDSDGTSTSSQKIAPKAKYIPDLKPLQIGGPLTYDHPDWCPVEIHPQNARVEASEKRLLVFRHKVSSKIKSMGFYHSSIVDQNPGSVHIPCVLGERMDPEKASMMFKFLMGCRHPNILKPLGLWNARDGVHAFVILARLDGVLSTIPIEEIFMNHNDILCGFTEEGFHMIRDIISAVNHVNMRYDSGSLPLLPLKLMPSMIFYVKGIKGSYHIQLGVTETALPSLDSVSLNEVTTANWNSLGDSLDTIGGQKDFDDELSSLINCLKNPVVSLEELSWEPGLWDVLTRVNFIREIVWAVEADQAKKSELESKDSIGLKILIDTLGYESKESNLYEDILFLRRKFVAHHDDPYLAYSGRKEDIGTEKAVFERFVRKEAPKYMLNLVKAIRALNWMRESPLLRSNTSNTKWFGGVTEVQHRSPTTAPSSEGLSVIVDASGT